MPIRPENRQRYPADWPAISRRIREDRAGGRCECDGRCGSGHCAAAQGRASQATLGFASSEHWRCFSVNGQPHPSTGSLVVLTVAHLDHTPEHCDDANLLAMCQACHLAYDAGHHAQSRAADLARRRAEHGQLTLDGPDG